MMKNKDQHVIPLGTIWAVKAGGTNKFTLITDSKRTAIKVAKEIAGHRRSKLIIHDKNMRIIKSIIPPVPKIDMR